MGLFPSRDDAPDRVRKICEAYREYGNDQIGITVVLDLLDPRGEWTKHPVKVPAGKDYQPPLPPGADPLTGCQPVTAS